MPEFVMDREGTVNGMTFADLSDIFQGYIEAMLFTSTSQFSMVDWESDEVQHDVREGCADGSIPADAGWGDIEPTCASAAQMDCYNFQSQARDLLKAAFATGDYDMTQAGRDFWFTRNHHGVGFWDRNLPDDLGDKLTDIAHSFGESDAMFEASDDSPTGYGYVYLS